MICSVAQGQNISYNYEIGEQKLKDFIKNGAGTTPRHNNNNQENTENYYLASDMATKCDIAIQ